jgi:anionic cell wall polymer biosynthesis LytR-Cps2A-Psr (LCP) family protein
VVKPRTERLVRVVVAVTASLAIIAGLGMGAFAARWYSLRTVSVVHNFHRAGGGGDKNSIPSGACTQPCNILLLGSDSRTGLSQSQQEQNGTNSDIGGTTRADTIMLVHLDPDTSKTVVLSFPRDLWVKIPGHGTDKINSAFEGGVENGGPELMAKTVFSLTHLPVDHFLYVDLNGFQKAVDTLGGVDMCIPSYYVNTPGDLEAVDPSGNITYIRYSEVGHVADPYTGLDVLPGCQHLGGEQALAYVRSRHNLPCSPIPDFARITRQQQFMRALINQMLKPSEFAKAPGLVGPVLSSLRRDSGFSPADLVYLVGQMRGISTGNVQFRSVSGTNAVVNGLDVVKMNPADKTLFEAIRTDAPLPDLGTNLPITPPSPANTIVEVIDAGNTGAASDVESTLSEAGFNVAPGIVQGAMPKGVTKAAVVYAPNKLPYAQVVHSYYPGLPLVEVKNLDVPVAVVVPHGYQPSSPTPTGGQSSPPPTGTECPGTTS